MRRELEETIMTGIQALPHDQKITLVLADIQGLSYQEVADSTGTSVGTVKSRLSRGRAKLRDYLVNTGELLPAQYRLKNSEGRR